MRNGIFGLFSLDGAPFDARDRRVLFDAIATDQGVVAAHSGADDLTARSAPGALVVVRDHATGAIHVHDDGTSLAVLLGDLDEPGALAMRLAMPMEANHAALAMAAHARWGRNAPAALAGEWLSLRWHAPSATLTLMMAEGAHEVCHVATDGRRVAVAPDLVRLARLGWVDATFDPDRLLRTMGRAHLRASIGAGTILKGVMRVRAGACITIRDDRVDVAAPDPWEPPAPASITFEDAIAELDALLRRIVRQRLTRANGIAIGLSGGLDSSLMGVLAAAARHGRQTLMSLTSAAPAGSGMADESGWAAIVAGHLDMPLVAVTPSADADVYRPSARTFAATESPTLSPRHYLYEALGDAAVAAGAQLLVDGSFGELTISHHGDGLGARWMSPRALARDMRDGWRDRWHDLTMPAWLADYHVMPARGAIAALGDPRTPSLQRPPSHKGRGLSDDAPLGFAAGFDRIGQQSTASGDARLRTVLPLRDPRLIRLMASYPAGFARHDGIDRAPIRALLRGRLPEAVVTRPKGLAFSPTYDAMLRDQAGAAIARLPDQRRAGAGDLLDLDWLARMLGHLRDGERLSRETMIRVQGTACAAAFLCWWQQAARDDD